jgi:hypothetical protein
MSLFDAEIETPAQAKSRAARSAKNGGFIPEAEGLFSDQTPVGELTVFRAELLGSEQTAWPQLFEGFQSLKAITYAISLEFMLRFVPQFEDAEIVFGSERILSKEHIALAQASQVIEAYGFADALADHKALTEGLGKYLGMHAQGLLGRVLDGSLRFRLLRKRPSHEKLYLLAGAAGYRVVTGSANLSAQAFESRQQEILVRFDGPDACRKLRIYSALPTTVF